MSGFLSHFACCFWWFLLGVLVGWLLNRMLCKCCKKSCGSSDESKSCSNADAPDVAHSHSDSAETTHAESTSVTASPAVMGLMADNKTATTEAKTSAKAPVAKKTAPKKETAVKSTDGTTTKPKTSKAKATSSVATAGFDAAAAKAAGFSIKVADDLTVVEGIGPKINELFKSNGVVTFADLAKQSVPQMRTILDAGGARFRIADPSTWAEQAALAAKNEWVALKKLQDELSGGIRK